jgi:hypothetical protein
MKHDNGAFKIYLKAKDLAERAHVAYIEKSNGLDSRYTEKQLVSEYQNLRAALYEMGKL